MIRDPQDPEIIGLCRQYGPTLGLQEGEPDGAAVLYALFLNERYDPADPNPRHEPGYDKGGEYCHGDQAVRVAQYGRAAACSYSNWQILYVTACELGYLGTPQQLDDDEVAIPYVCRDIVRRIERRARTDGPVTIQEIAEGYNTGNPHGHGAPAYEARLVGHYQTALVALG